jgi:hypothetical protein
LHGDECEDDRVEAVGVTRLLEVLVVLFAGLAGAGVELISGYVLKGGEV